MLGDEKGKGLFGKCFLHVRQWILNSCGREEKAWEEWMSGTEKQKQ